MGFFNDLFGPRQPCSLCQLGKQSWPGDRSGTADWKIRGDGLHVSLLVCVPCRQFLIQTKLLYRTPMLALASLVEAGVADRPPLDTYLQHPGWRTIWMHILESSGSRPRDEFAALQMMRPLEEEFMRGTMIEDVASLPVSEAGAREIGPGLRAMMTAYGIPDEVIKAKYVSYAMALRMSGKSCNWNDEVDDHARRVGALTESEIETARTDLHQAILNRVKIALVTEGWWPVEPA
jgi:hypothetical protein